ncbi:MAG: Rossmann-fold NAD(P)-binding domain-containing protein, partial [Planctomycetota bacterium]
MDVLIGTSLSDEDAASMQAVAPRATMHFAEDREDVLARIGDVEVYMPGPCDAEVFAAAGPELKWVHFPWAGLDGCVPEEFAQRDVVITNSAGVFAIPMAEHAVALMLAFARGVYLCAGRGPEEVWHGEGAREGISSAMHELKGATLGILGYGGIGRAT